MIRHAISVFALVASVNVARSETSHGDRSANDSVRTMAQELLEEIAVESAAIERNHATGIEYLRDVKFDVNLDLSLGAWQDETVDPLAGADEAGGEGDLASQATNPASSLIQFQIQNTFIRSSYASDGYANTFVIQPVIPLPAKGWFPRSIWRPTIPIVTTPDLDSGVSQTTGLGDITIIGGPVFDYDWGMLVVGGALTAPTSTDARLGARKWQLGPLVGPIFTKVIPKVQFGAIAYNQWAIGGSGSQYTNTLSIQPILTIHLNDGWYTGMGDYLWTVNWETDDVYVPLSVKLGRVFQIGDQGVNMFVSPYFNVGDDVPGQGEYGIKLSFSLLFPTG